MFFRFIGPRRKAIDLDNIYSGSCFLAGGGLTDEEARKLENPNIVTMAMNNTAAMFTPTLWAGADKPEHYSTSILKNPSIMKFTYITRSRRIVEDTPWKNLPNTMFITGIGTYKPNAFFARGRDFLWWRNVFMMSLQILHRLGFNRVYTVGCGFNISKESQYGFESDLTPEQIKYNQRTYSMVINQVKEVLQHAPDAHFEVVSCTPNSRLHDSVRYQELDSALEEEVAKVPEHSTVDCLHPVPRNAPEDRPSISLLMPAFQRDDLMELGLSSIARQKVPNLEILVLNDGIHSEATQKLAEKHGAKYIFTGQRNEGKETPHWRIPGFAFNIGAKQAAGEILILTCAEMWHTDDNCIEQLVAPVALNKGVVSIPEGRDDDGEYLEAVNNGGPTAEGFDRLKSLRNELPFLIALHKDTFFEMRGYDEDFTGRAFDDDDLVERLKAMGCPFVHAKSRCVHLYHPRMTVENTGDGERVAHNKRLFMERRGTVQRNTNRDWGVLEPIGGHNGNSNGS